MYIWLYEHTFRRFWLAYVGDQKKTLQKPNLMLSERMIDIILLQLMMT